VLPVWWRGRLLLFWFRILQEPPLDPQNLPTTSASKDQLMSLTLADLKGDARADAQQGSIAVRAVLCWSEYYNGGWQSPKTSDVNRPILLGKFTSSMPFDRSKFLLFAIAEEPALRLVVGDNLTSPSASFLFYNSHSTPVVENSFQSSPTWPPPFRVVGDANESPEGDRFLTAMYWPGGAPPKPYLALVMLRSTAPFSVAQPWYFPLQEPFNPPFLFADSRRAYYVTSMVETISVPDFAGFGFVMPSAASQHVDGPAMDLAREPSPDVNGPPVAALVQPALSALGAHSKLAAGVWPGSNVRYDGQEIGPLGARWPDQALRG
jgi:hypothetical protein